MKESFDRVMDFILTAEGGYVNDPDDPGGETKFGISKRSFPKEDIKNLSVGRAKEIYRENYWKAIDGDSLVSPLDLYLMDTAVNCGVGTARRIASISSDPDDFLFNRISYYLTIVKKHPPLKKYLYNWIHRTVECHKEAMNG